MHAAVRSTFDVVAWFTDRALNDGEYLQPQKLHHLLFLAQAYYAVAHRGARLMPTIFVAEETGPLVPDVARVLTGSRSYVESEPMTIGIEDFLDSVWRRFGSHTSDFLGRQICAHPPFAMAAKKGRRSEITLEAMVDYYGAPLRSSAANDGAPPLSHVLRPKVMRSHTGRPVSVQRWAPPSASAKKNG